MNMQEAQILHETRRREDPSHDRCGCWCCCLDCDFDFNEVMNILPGNSARQTGEMISYIKNMYGS